MNTLGPSPLPFEVSATADPGYHNSLPLLHEIAHALRLLRLKGTTTTLDLSAIPFGPGDERLLLECLGRGEVSAKLEALGDSHIWESAYPGVWVIEHRNSCGERIAFQVEITRLPSILETRLEDIEEGLLALQRALANLQTDKSV